MHSKFTQITYQLIKFGLNFIPIFLTLHNIEMKGFKENKFWKS
jgi:hypothetical protein